MPNVFPKISIVTPNFNQGDFIEETILSVLGQNYPNLEYIIIDGGSTDNSVEIIKKYESQLSYWISEKDSGMYEAIQKGFAKSTGDIMAWLNSDDKYHPNAFFVVAEIFDTFKNIEWFSGASSQYNEKGYTIDVARCRVFTKYQYLAGDYIWIQQESTFFKRTLWEKSGGYIDEHLKYAGDFELWLRFFNYAKRYNCDVLVAGFRQRHANQKSLEGIINYHAEIKEIMAIQKLTNTIKLKLLLVRGLNFLFIFIQKKSFFRRLYLKVIDAPETISFNRITQKFEMIK